MTSVAAHPALGPEAQLLLLTAGLQPPAERIRTLLGGPLEWPYLLQLAAHQRALPQMWRSLEAQSPEGLPRNVAAEVKPLLMVGDFTMGLLRDRFQEAVAALSSAGIRVLALKGAGLALTVYPSFTERPMGDIDLLTDRGSAAAAIRILHGLGWATELVEGFERFYREHHHLSPLRYAGSQVRLELHTDLFAPGHPFVLPLEDLWRRSRRVEIRSGEVWTFDPLDATIHLATHFLWSHGGVSGAWRTFRDVDVLVRSGSLDWDELDVRAEAARAQTCIYWTLRLARRLAGIRIPEAAIARFRPAGTEFLLSRLEHHLATGILPSTRACPSMTMTRWMWEAVVQPRRSGHGNARPWSRSEVVREVFLAPESDSLARRAISQFQRLGAWQRYITALVSPLDPRASP
jgi:hypothetical protein